MAITQRKKKKKKGKIKKKKKEEKREAGRASGGGRDTYPTCIISQGSIVQHVLLNTCSIKL